jgi:hypothetical protein
MAQRPQKSPQAGGGMPVIEYWAAQTLSLHGPKLWQTLLHKSALAIVLVTFWNFWINLKLN